jgi:hypothetical protein
MRYTKDLTHLTTLRLSPSLREEAERYAEFLGISFSAFVRQSITRNIHVSRDIENEVVERTSRATRGLPL